MTIIKWPKISKRMKLILVIFGSFLLLTLSSLTILAKTGTINIRMLADTLVGTTYQNVVITALDQSGSAVPGAWAGATKLPTGIPFTGTTDSRGKWIVTLENGNYNFSVGISPECRGVLNNQIVSSVLKNYTVRITCSPIIDPGKAIIRGKVLEEGTATALADSLVSTDVGSYAVTAIANGSYELRVNPGSYSLSASKIGYHMSAAPLYEGDLLAGKTYDAPNILMTKDTAPSGGGGDTGEGGGSDVLTGNFDVFGNIVLDNAEGIAVEVELELACSYMKKDGNIANAPIIKLDSMETFQAVNYLKYNFRFQNVPRKYQGADFKRCSLSVKPADDSVLDVYPITEVSYTTAQALGKIAMLPPLGKDAAYFHKIGLKIKDEKNSLRIMGKITDYKGNLTDNIDISLIGPGSNSVSTKSTNLILSPAPFGGPTLINYKIDYPNYIFGSQLNLSIIASGIQPQLIDLRQGIVDGKYKLLFNSANGFFLVLDLSVSNNDKIVANNFTGQVYLQYKYEYSSGGVAESGTKSSKEFISGVSVEYTVSNESLKYLVSGRVSSAGQYGLFEIGNIPVSLAEADKNKDIVIKLKIIKDGFNILEDSVVYKNEISSYAWTENYRLNPSDPKNYEICLKVIDNDGKFLNFSEVYVFPGDVKEFSTIDEFNAASWFSLPSDEINSIVRKGKWSVFIKDYKDVLKRTPSGSAVDGTTAFSIFIIPGNNIKNVAFPLKRTVFIDATTLLKMSDSFTITDGTSKCREVIVSHKEPVETTNDYTIDLYDAETGDPIDVKKDEATISLGYKLIDNWQYDLDESYYTQEYSLTAPNRLVIKIKSTRDLSEPKKLLYYSGNNYRLTDGGVDIKNSDFPVKLYLLDESAAESGMPCIEFSGFKFCGLKFPTMDVLTAEQKLNISKVAKLLSVIKSAASDKREIPIYIQTKPFNRANASRYPKGIKHSAFTNKTGYFSLSYVELNDYSALLKTAVHEYAHTIDFMSGLSEKDKFKFDQITIEGNTGVARAMMLDNDCCNEKQFPDFNYAKRTNSYELWAEFFSWWFLHNDEFRQAIADESTVSEPCKQVLRFMYAVLQQTFPSVAPYDQASSVSSANTDIQMGFFSTKALLSAAGSSSSSLDAIMLEAGFKKTTKLIKTEAIVPLNSTVFTADQIYNGTWVKRNYDASKLSDKVAIQYQTMVSTIKTSAILQSISSVAVTAVNKFNQSYDALLKKIGLYKNTGNVKGTIVDESGIGVANMMVGLGGKYAVTDQKGLWSIKGVQSGFAEINSVKDLYTNEEYLILNPTGVKVVESRTVQLHTIIKFPKVKLIGKLTDKRGVGQKNKKIVFIGSNKKKSEVMTDNSGNYSAEGFYYQKYSVTVYSGKSSLSLSRDYRSVEPKKATVGDDKMKFDIRLSK